MTDEVRRGKIGEVAHRRKRAVDRVALQAHLRGRLARECFVPRGSVGPKGKDVRGFIGEPIRYLRVESTSRPLTQYARSKLRAAEHVLECGVAGDVNDPQGERDLVPLETPGLALAVPALGEMDPQRLQGPRQPESLGQHLCYLAQRDEVASMAPNRSREPAHSLSGPNWPRPIRWRQGAHDPRHHFGP